MSEAIPGHGICFGCGDENPGGLGMRYFVEEDGSVTGRYTPQLAQQGARGISHGGVLFTILDEAMGKAVWKAGHRCLTATAEIRFLRAARLDEELAIRAWVEGADERGTVEARAEALGPDGKAVARTSGRFRPAPRQLAYAESS
ncbi:MAG: PaaI family thioesterase [Myxococcota bacterium]|nr:PaaI family thioesterase [Myxococcota bacterium]